MLPATKKSLSAKAEGLFIYSATTACFGREDIKKLVVSRQREKAFSLLTIPFENEPGLEHATLSTSLPYIYQTSLKCI